MFFSGSGGVAWSWEMDGVTDTDTERGGERQVAIEVAGSMDGSVEGEVHGTWNRVRVIGLENPTALPIYEIASPPSLPSG